MTVFRSTETAFEQLFQNSKRERKGCKSSVCTNKSKAMVYAWQTGIFVQGGWEWRCPFWRFVFGHSKLVYF